MKKIFIVLVIGLIWSACTEEKVGVYSLEEDFIYLPYNNSTMGGTTIPDTLLYNRVELEVNLEQQLDTFYFRVNVAGKARNINRKIKIVEYPIEINDNYEQAKEGVNYVAFDGSEMEKHLILPADSLGIDLPIIVKYDQGIAGETKRFTVAFRLADSEDFKVMSVNSNLTAGNTARACGYVSFSQKN